MARDATPRLANRKVLIVEDSPELASVYSAILTADGAKAVVACTMRDGLAKSFSFEPDLILCDLSMAHGSGFDFIAAVRAMEKDTGRHVAAAAVTGHSDDYSRTAAKACGFDECLAKPVTHDVLVDAARRLLAPHLTLVPPSARTLRFVIGAGRTPDPSDPAQGTP